MRKTVVILVGSLIVILTGIGLSLHSPIVAQIVTDKVDPKELPVPPTGFVYIGSDGKLDREGKCNVDCQLIWLDTSTDVIHINNLLFYTSNYVDRLEQRIENLELLVK